MASIDSDEKALGFQNSSEADVQVDLVPGERSERGHPTLRIKTSIIYVMDVSTTDSSVFCLIEDVLAGKCLRTGEPRQTLYEEDALGTAGLGVFLRIDMDRDIWRHFRKHWWPLV